MVDILRRMGARLTQDATSVTVFPSPLSGIAVDMAHCPDLVPTVAACAALGRWGRRPSKTRPICAARESDRWQALGRQPGSGPGARAEGSSHGLRIEHMARPRRVVFKTYDDHRMAMSMALFGLAGIDTRFDNPGCVAKSFPRFFDEWSKVTS
jgi:3-phosphoshikimate 1-carboxyvinyltransferase